MDPSFLPPNPHPLVTACPRQSLSSSSEPQATSEVCLPRLSIAEGAAELTDLELSAGAILTRLLETYPEAQFYVQYRQEAHEHILKTFSKQITPVKGELLFAISR